MEDKTTALFLCTPSESGDPRALMAEEASRTLRYANRHGLRIVQRWMVHEDPHDRDTSAFQSFAHLVWADSEIEVVLLGSMEGAIRSSEDLFAILALVMEEGREIHCSRTGLAIGYPFCKEELLEFVEKACSEGRKSA